MRTPSLKAELGALPKPWTVYPTRAGFSWSCVLCEDEPCGGYGSRCISKAAADRKAGEHVAAKHQDVERWLGRRGSGSTTGGLPGFGAREPMP